MPWADICYGVDGAWWKHRKGLPEFQGTKVCGDESACREYRDLCKITVDVKTDSILTERSGHLGYGKNSGFQAINLVVQFGARRIILVGFDMRIDLGLHWHGRHGGRLNNPSAYTIMRWRHVLEAAAPDLAALGVTVLNASPDSALTAYRKVDFLEALRNTVGLGEVQGQPRVPEMVAA